MDLSTTYLGLQLHSPLMPGASPLADKLDNVKRLEDAGAAAIVLYSLFEEQILDELFREEQDVEAAANSFAEALSFFPRADEYRASGTEKYLEKLRGIKEAVGVPVIASLNGVSPGGWVDYARQCQEAGADAVELNVYYLPTDAGESGTAVEERVVSVARAVKASLRVPVAVKLSPFFSSLPNLVRRLQDAGVDGVVLFNRFYQPDIDVEQLEVAPKLRLSDSGELLLRLRWVAILAGRVQLSLGVTGGVHTAADAVKALMCGADAVQMVSALLQNGPGHLAKVRDDLARWLEEHGYASLGQMKGSMSLEKSPNPGAFERANYVRLLQGGTKRA